MNCDGVRGLLSAYVDGELSAGELLRVEQHLRRCHWCADEVDALRQTIALLASLDEVEVPATFHAQLHERLVALGPPVQMARTSSVSRPKRPDFRRWAIPAAAAAALVIGAAGLNRLNPPEPVSRPPFGQTIVGVPTDTNPVQPPTSGERTPDPGGPTDVPNNEGPKPVEPPPGNAQGGAQTPGVTQPPTVPVDQNAGGGPGNNPPPLGPINSGNGIRTASYLDGVTEPTTLPSQRQPRASLEATVADPAAVAAALESHFTGAVNKNVNVGIIQLQITVAAKGFAQDLVLVEEQLGVKSVEDGVELNSQLDDAYQRIAALETERTALEARLAKETDPQALEAGKLALQNLEEQANLYKDAFKRLLNQVENGVITVTLKPVKAQ